jgi:hypothetical protein
LKNPFRSKKYFFETFKNIRILEAIEFNYFNVVFSSLFSQYSKRSKIPTTFLFERNIFVFFCILCYKAIREIQSNKWSLKNRDKEYLIVGICRPKVYSSGDSLNPYTHIITQALGREKCHIHFINTPPYNYTEFDSISKIIPNAGIRHFKQIIVIKNDLKKVINQLKAEATLNQSDLADIRTGFDLFIRDFIKYLNFFTLFKNTKKLFIFPAYQNEAIVLAAKLLNIEVVELQHGLIGSDSRFYVYPETVNMRTKKLILPDRILVWGQYWKEVLLKGFEYSKENIHISGDFIYRPEVVSKQKLNVLLISTNKYCQNVFIPFILKQVDYIQSQHNEWTIYLKLHPSDKRNNEYYEIFNNYESIKIIEGGRSIEELIAIAKIHVTLFSVVIFESLGLNIKNYCLLADNNHSESDEFVGFQKEISNAGIADIITAENDVIQTYLNSNKTTDSCKREYVFAALSKDRFQA